MIPDPSGLYFRIPTPSGVTALGMEPLRDNEGGCAYLLRFGKSEIWGALINLSFRESEIWGAFIFEDFHTMEGGCAYLFEI